MSNMANRISDYSTIPASVFSGRTTQLNDFVEKLQLDLFDSADKVRSSLSDAEKVREYAQKMKSEFIKRLGGVPERAKDLNAKTLNTIKTDNFTVETIVFTPRENVHATATLYIPNNIKLPAPAVLFLCGHSENGRMYATYQRAIHTLVATGLIVFALDPTGQGERRNFYDPESGKTLVNVAIHDHDFAGMASMCTGRFIEAFFVNDQYAAVDYMLTRKEIDPERIGVTGCSGGGLQSLCTMVCDDRIAAAAPATFTSTRREILFTHQGQDAEQIWPGCTEYGFDHFEPYIIFAPKPVRILTVDSDFFPLEGALEVYDEMKRIYSLFGKEDNIDLFTDRACHEYTLNLAKKAAEFFAKVFNIPYVNNFDPSPFADEILRATKSGNVKGDFEGSMLIPDENVAYLDKIMSEKEDKDARAWLSEKVNRGRVPSEPFLRIFDARFSSYTPEHTGKAAMWWVQKRLAAYGILISKGRCEKVMTYPTVIALWDGGTKAIEAHEEWIKKKCDEGYQVLVVDLPGVGNLEQARLCGGYTHLYGTIYKICCDLLYLGDSMPAMQTYHVIKTVDMLKDVIGVEGVSLYCDGKEGVYGIMAGYLTGIEREYGENLFTDVENDIVRKKLFPYDNTLAYLMPDMLKHFDYKDLM